jgi:hypothetical protein
MMMSTHLIMLILFRHCLLLCLPLTLVAMILKPNFHLRAKEERMKEWKIRK